MLKNALASFSPSFKLITSDRVNLILAIIPVIIGIIVYLILGTLFFEHVRDWGTAGIDRLLPEGKYNYVLHIMLVFFSSIFLLFIVNFTFVIVTTIIAAPFNDILSARIEKKLLGKHTGKFSEEMDGIFKTFFSILFREARKLILILLMTLVAFVIGMIPFIAPLAAFLTCLLLSSGFLDYTWSRHSLGVRQIVREVKGNVWGYGIAGAFFFFLTSVPVVNLMVSPWATSYFTLLWVKNHESVGEISG